MIKFQTKKINLQDYSSANQEDFAKLSRSLNPLMDDLERILREVSVEFKELMVEVDASGIPKSAIKLNTILTTSIKGCTIVKADALEDGIFPVSSPFPIWNTKNATLEVTKIIGLPANKLFSITIRMESNG